MEPPLSWPPSGFPVTPGADLSPGFQDEVLVLVPRPRPPLQHPLLGHGAFAWLLRLSSLGLRTCRPRSPAPGALPILECPAQGADWPLPSSRPTGLCWACCFLSVMATEEPLTDPRGPGAHVAKALRTVPGQDRR